MNEHSNALSRRAFLGCALTAGAATAISAIPTEALAVTAAEKQAEADAALNKLRAMQEELSVASDNYATAVDAQNEAQSKMEEAQGRIDEASGQISELQDQLGARARSMYRTGSLSFIDLLMGATSFQAFTNNWDLLNDMNEADAEMVEETKTLRAEVQEQKKVYEAEEATAAEEAQKAAEVKAQAETLVADMQSTYDSLSSEAAELLRQEEAAREAAEAAAAEEAARRAQQSSGGSSSSNSEAFNDSKVPTVSGNVAVDRAYSQLGIPYVYGTGIPGVSFDCSGLVGYCLTGRSGHPLGSTGTMAKYPRVSNPQPGDICWRSSHVGLYIGGGQMIHAPHTGDVVKIASVPSNMIYRRY